MRLQTVKFVVRKWKSAGLAQEIRFSAPNSCSLPWLVKCTTQLCTSKKECNKLDLNVAQYFWLVDQNDWWFAITSSHVYAVSLVGLLKKKAILRHLILLCRVTYWAPVEVLLNSDFILSWLIYDVKGFTPIVWLILFAQHKLEMQSWTKVCTCLWWEGGHEEEVVKFGLYWH